MDTSFPLSPQWKVGQVGRVNQVRLKIQIWLWAVKLMLCDVSHVLCCSSKTRPNRVARRIGHPEPQLLRRQQHLPSPRRDLDGEIRARPEGLAGARMRGILSGKARIGVSIRIDLMLV